MSAIGTGGKQVAVVALLAMSATAVLGASPAVVTNAGIAAVLIATVQPAHGFYSPTAARGLVDVLIGGATSLAVLVLLPAHSLSSTRRAATALLVELSAALDEVASALERRDEQAAVQALEHARGLDSFVGRLRDESDLAHEAVLLAPVDRQRRLLLDRYRAAAPKRSSRSATCASSLELAYAQSSSTPQQGSSCWMRFVRSHPRDRP